VGVSRDPRKLLTTDASDPTVQIDTLVLWKLMLILSGGEAAINGFENQLYNTVKQGLLVSANNNTLSSMLASNQKFSQIFQSQ